MKSIPLTETPEGGVYFQWPIDKRGSYFCIFKKDGDTFFSCSFIVEPNHPYYKLDTLPFTTHRKCLGKFPVLRDDNKRVEFIWNYLPGTEGWKQSGFFESDYTVYEILERNMETINMFLKHSHPKWQNKFRVALEMFRLENPLYNKKIALKAGIKY